METIPWVQVRSSMVHAMSTQFHDIVLTSEFILKNGFFLHFS